MIDKKVQILSKTVSSKQQGGVSSSVSGGSSSVVYNNIDLLSLDAIAEPSEHNAFSALRALYEQKKEIENRLIKSKDEKEADDSTFYTSLRTLKEINNSIKNLYDIFLRKDQPDKTEHLITFLKGLKIGAKYSINEVGDAVLNNIKSSVIDSIQAKFHELESTKLKASEGTIDTLTALTLFVKTLADVEELNVKETATILNAVVKASLSSPKFTSGFLGEGFRLAKTESGDWNLEIDTLTVRKVFQVFELLIQEVKHQGGVVVHSPAGGKITKVTDGGSYWKCEVESADTFFKDDLVLCQKFTGKNIKRYWRLATSAGDGYINLSKTDCEANSAIPEVDDEIVQLGNRTNVARQNAQLVSVVGEDSPYIDDYMGIKSYSLEDNLVQRSGNLAGIIDKDFGQLKGSGIYSQNAYLKGSFNLRNGKSVETVISETSNKLSGDIGKVQADLQKDVNTSVNSVKNELGATITNVENNFNTSLNSTKNELNSSISKVQGDADTAKGLAQSAQDSVDGLEIGGRNLLQGSSYPSKGGGSSVESTEKLVDGTIKITVNSAGGLFYSMYIDKHIHKFLENGLSNNDNIVISAWIKTEGNVKRAPNVYLREEMGYRKMIGVITQSYSQLWATRPYFETPSNYFNMHFKFPEAGVYYFKYAKIEKGNKPTDWTPAPEDTEAQISKSKEEAEAAAKAYADAQDTLLKTQQEAYADGKITAEEQRAIEDAKAKLEAAKKYADAQDALLKTQQEAYADGKVTASEKRAIADATNKVNAAKSELNALVSKAQSTADDAKSAIDGLEIGGRNLFQQSNYSKHLHSQGTIHSSATSAVIKVEPNTTYTISYTVTESNRFGIYQGDLPDGDISKSFLNVSTVIGYITTAEGSKINRTFTTGSVGEFIFVYLSFGIGPVKEPYLKIEKGTKPTDWTPAPEDTEAQITKSKEEAEAAAKAYTDAQDNLKQIESKAYADGRVTEEEKRAIADAKAKLDAAKAYTDAQDAVLKTQQEAYADGIVTEAEQRAIDEAQNRVDKAKDELNALIEGVKESVTKEIKDVEQRFEIADGQINSHIKETTQLVTEAKLANGESIKTLEQVKVQINDINVTAGKINTTLGEVTKKQGEINSSISNLEQTAGSIKTSIEGFKETEAEIKATANRIEATHKGIVLEASEKSAQKAIDDLEIGGRNLISGSGGVYLKRLGEYGRKIVEYNGKISVLHDRGTILHFAAKTTDTIKKGGSYVYSFKMCCNEGIVKMASHIYINGKEGIIRSVNDTEITTEWKMFYISSVAKVDIKEVAIHHYLAKTLTDTDQIVYLTEYKLEKGNKPTDWTPAPEDIEDKIETTRTEFDSKLEITKEAITATSTKIDGLTGRVQETEAKLEPDRLWVAVKDNSQKLIDDLDLVNRNYAYVRDTVIYVSNDFPRNSKQYLSLSLWGNFEEFTNADPFSQIYFSRNLYSPFLDYKYTKKSDNHIVFEGGYVDLSLETYKDLKLYFGWDNPEELITKAKIDLGTKATDWTPAPEELLTPEDIRASIELTTNGLDVFGKHHSFTGKVTFASLASDAQGKINTAQSTANTAQSTANTALTNANSAGSNLTALQSRLGELAYEDMVERAKLGSTIIEGGYLRTELIEAKSITAEKIDVDSIFANRIRTGNLDVIEGATIAGWEVEKNNIYAERAKGNYYDPVSGAIISKIDKYVTQIDADTGTFNSMIYPEDSNGDFALTQVSPIGLYTQAALQYIDLNSFNNTDFKVSSALGTDLYAGVVGSIRAVASPTYGTAIGVGVAGYINPKRKNLGIDKFYGGFFQSMLVTGVAEMRSGMCLNIRKNNLGLSNYYLLITDYIVTNEHQWANIYLPRNPRMGQTYIIKNAHCNRSIVKSIYGFSIYTASGEMVNEITLEGNNFHTFIFDNTQWYADWMS